ncbi:hypothetical protein NUV89_02765 [Pseudomonas sp. 18.1.10]|uniref:gp53-like domain-containing protein n=1 Tax=Pseudomonas sp. 18.1.10 TaxID=2969302 RepID=UPI00214FFB36|nr:hypothetical protein [Pseudomonas sp. 18.1.10]MCR4537310.1 hypothetical protein [Pseudomonas sp. 18.1.10]
MQKISSSTATANGAGEFTQGQPGSGIDATMITVAWLNAIQRELVNLVVGSGQPLTPADDGQVLKAVKALQELASAWDKITGKPTTRDGYKLSDVFTKTETGTAIQNAVSALVASSPTALDTLKELADALGNDPNFATTVTNSIAGKLPVGGGNYRPKLLGVGVTDNASGFNVQGGYIGWGNAEMGLAGAMQFLCNRGAGAGGFVWRGVNADNSQSGPAMWYSYDGWLSVNSLAVGVNSSAPTPVLGDNSKKIANTEFVAAWTAQYPVRDAITTVGLASGDKNQPYMRHASTGDLVMLQPLKAKDTALLSPNGWSKNADTGEIIQWCEYVIGDAQGATSSITVTWPFQFPAQCLNIRTSFRVASGSPGRMIASSYALTTSGTTILLEEATTAVQSGLVLMIEVRGN